jgi:hypothetical protein
MPALNTFHARQASTIRRLAQALEWRGVEREVGFIIRFGSIYNFKDYFKK